MGGNGTFAAGNIVKYRWKTVGTVHGVKILEPISGSHKLPEEAHASRMYLQLHDDGTFSQMRIYDKWHRLRIEIGFHPERRLDPSGKNVLHYHIYKHPCFRHEAPHRMSERNFKRYRKYLKGVAEP